MNAEDICWLIERGWGLADRSQPDRTIEYFRTLACRFPDHAQALYAYACALDFAGEEEAAAAAYEQCPWEELEEDDQVRGQIQYAATLRNIGRLDEALRAITELRERNPLDPAPAVYESLIRVDRGEPVAAVQLLLTHILQTTTDEKLLRYRWALERYTEALSLDPSDPGPS